MKIAPVMIEIKQKYAYNQKLKFHQFMNNNII